MKRITPLFLISLITLISCRINVDDEMELTSSGVAFILILIFIILILIVFPVLGVIINGGNTKKAGFDMSKLMRIGKYIGGHPSIDKFLHFCSMYREDDKLFICNNRPDMIPQKLGKIPISAIKNILIEDSSSIERKITLGRVLLVGVFALLWRKKVKNEMAFLSVEWNDGRFDHTALFSYEGKNAHQKANIDRNSLLRLIK